MAYINQQDPQQRDYLDDVIARSRSHLAMRQPVTRTETPAKEQIRQRVVQQAAQGSEVPTAYSLLPSSNDLIQSEEEKKSGQGGQIGGQVGQVGGGLIGGAAGYVFSGGNPLAAGAGAGLGGQIGGQSGTMIGTGLDANDRLSNSQQTQLWLSGGAGPELIALDAIISDVFGSGKNPRDRQRDGVISWLKDNTNLSSEYSTTGLGYRGIDNELIEFGDHKLDDSHKLTPYAVSLSDPIAEFLAGGDPSVREDVSAMIANSAISNATSEEDIRKNILNFIHAIGFTAEQVRDILKNSGLDKNRLETYALSMSILTGNTFEEEFGALGGKI